MNDNAYRGRAERGEVQIGTWVTMIRTPAVLTLVQAAGLDFVRVDMEHSAFSMETIVNFSSETAVLRAGYAAAVAEIRRPPAPRG
jgi:2-keto-3-deoxy-L-rhamnonate aldolase RhmA